MKSVKMNEPIDKFIYDHLIRKIDEGKESLVLEGYLIDLPKMLELVKDYESQEIR